MFYYLIAPLLTYNFILIAAAVIPALYLLVSVYKRDRLEQESPNMIFNLVKAGVFSALIALVLEKIFSQLLIIFVNPDSDIYRFLLYFVVVAVSEEGAKYFMLKRSTWNAYEFDCLYDGIVSAVSVSLGLALWENISYVLHFGLANALVRAFTAIPGHACFGIFMGVFYSASKFYEMYEDIDKSKKYSILSLLVPVLIHGAYDYIATMPTAGNMNYLFILFIAVLFYLSSRVVKSVSSNDRYLS